MDTVTSVQDSIANQQATPTASKGTVSQAGHMGNLNQSPTAKIPNGRILPTAFVTVLEQSLKEGIDFTSAKYFYKKHLSL